MYRPINRLTIITSIIYNNSTFIYYILDNIYFVKKLIKIPNITVNK